MNNTLGIDVGSVSVKAVVLDGAGTVAFEEYRRTHGRPRSSQPGP